MSERATMTDRELFEKGKAGSFFSRIDAQLQSGSGVDGERPFLSVLMRTQGKRPRALYEALLSLCDQTFGDFEVLLMLHNAEESGKAAAVEVIDSFDEEFTNKIKMIEVTGGNRTAPLKSGFENARGLYVSIFDDDDIVYKNWAEEFKKLSEKAPGRILHAYALRQMWESAEENGKTVLRPTHRAEKTHAKPFSLHEQLTVNSCPTFSLAFPLYVYTLLGVRFDETLDTTEDWDFLMHAALLCGVADTPEVTGVYRVWENAENSQTLHKQEEWQKNYFAVRSKIAENGGIIEQSDVEDILAYKKTKGDVVTQYESADALAALKTAELYIDDGSGFSQYNVCVPKVFTDGERFEMVFEDVAEFCDIYALRLDPAQNARLLITELTLTAGDKTFNIKDFSTNGFILKEGILCLYEDPQLILNARLKGVKTITVAGRAKGDITDEQLLALAKGGKRANASIKGIMGKAKKRFGL